ncbi:hypothetical protein CPC16_010547 [Podila verticillata]|nr:hypothetical protein CPC16_010547 [Podila verticillata]
MKVILYLAAILAIVGAAVATQDSCWAAMWIAQVCESIPNVSICQNLICLQLYGGGYPPDPFQNNTFQEPLYRIHPNWIIKAFMSVMLQKFNCGSAERELHLISSKVPHESLFVYVDDVLEAFKILDADRFEANGRTIAYVQDDIGAM